jgi:hypothetical protein
MARKRMDLGELEKKAVLMTAADKKRIDDIDNGIAMLLDGVQLKSVDNEIEAIRNDIVHLQEMIAAIGRAVGAEKVKRRPSGRRGPSSKINKSIGRPGLDN